MLFSIIIPVYNVEKYLNECVDSILSQVRSIDSSCEILLIDDGSTDKSGKICDEYVVKHPDLIKVYHKKNEGLLLTRRYGFRRALGKYIINCDSDDLLEPNMMKSIWNTICKYNYPDMIIFNHNMYNNGNKTVAYENIFTEAQDCSVEKEEVLRKYMLGHSVVSVWAKIFKRTCINTDFDYSKFGRLSTGEDTLQSIEFFSNAKTYVYLNEALYDYRCGSGMTAKFDANYYFSFKKIFEEIQKQKVDWKLGNFDELFAVKVLQTVGRAITQSRLNKWKSILEQKQYLKTIRNDDMLIQNIKYLTHSKKYMQFDHYILLKLLNNNHYFIIIMLLLCKNKIENTQQQTKKFLIKV